MEDDNQKNIQMEVLRRISICLKCNRKVHEDYAFCMENELPISLITTNTNIECPLGKF